MYINYITITLSRRQYMDTITQELKQYITRLFQLSNNETWECEALEEEAENILPTRFVDHTPLAHLTLETYTYYNDVSYMS